MMGAAAFSGVARAVSAFGPDPEEESKYCHVMTVVRGCGGDGSALRYRTELVEEHCPDSFPTEIIKVVWTGKSNATAEDSVDPLSAKEKSQLTEAAQALIQFIGDETKPAVECERFLKDAGFDPEKVNTSYVRKKAGVTSKRGGSGFQWSRQLKPGNSRVN
jgi:hypothetical protein